MHPWSVMSRHKDATGYGNTQAPAARVLVAEDDDEIRLMITTALRRDGYDVLEVKSGGELLDQVGSSLLFRDSMPAPDIIITDIRMPGFTGLEIAAGLRGADCRTPVVLITAYSNHETALEARRLGAPLFEKPFELDDLQTALLNLVSERARRRG